MKIRVTDTARWQLRLTIQHLMRNRDPRARELASAVRELLLDPVRLVEALRPLDGIPEAPTREVIVGTYHLHFREAGDTLWLSCLWPPIDAAA